MGCGWKAIRAVPEHGVEYSRRVPERGRRAHKRGRRAPKCGRRASERGRRKSESPSHREATKDMVGEAHSPRDDDHTDRHSVVAVVTALIFAAIIVATCLTIGVGGPRDVVIMAQFSSVENKLGD